MDSQCHQGWGGWAPAGAPGFLNTRGELGVFGVAPAPASDRASAATATVPVPAFMVMAEIQEDFAPVRLRPVSEILNALGSSDFSFLVFRISILFTLSVQMMFSSSVLIQQLVDQQTCLGASMEKMLQADCLHKPCYCEENVYHLIQKLSAEGRWVHAVFITNAARICPFWRQKAGSGTAGLVVWDYHVVCLEQRSQGPALIWDLDRQEHCACLHYLL